MAYTTGIETKTILLVAVLIAASGLAFGQDQPSSGSDQFVFVGAGDIANCDLLGGARATAGLLDVIAGTVFTLGDHAYAKGTVGEFSRCYEPTWGRHKARTRPTPGNHDYLTDRGRPYFEYFGAAAGLDQRGYYSFELGEWHIISLNSASPRSLPAQMKWLREDLAAHAADCVLAYWHAPVFSSGPHTPDPTMHYIWSILYKAGADVVLNGHDHIYERFAPQDDKGKPDAEHGIRQFIAGTGGGGVYKLGRIARNSEVHSNSAYGVLKLTLSPGRYAWEFVPIPGARVQGRGHGLVRRAASEVTAWPIARRYRAARDGPSRPRAGRGHNTVGPRRRSKKVPRNLKSHASQQGIAARHQETRRIASTQSWSSRRCTQAAVSCVDRAASQRTN